MGIESATNEFWASDKWRELFGFGPEEKVTYEDFRARASRGPPPARCPGPAGHRQPGVMKWNSGSSGRMELCAGWRGGRIA